MALRVIAALPHLFSPASHIFYSCSATSLPITQGSFQQCSGEGGVANQMLLLRELSLLQGDMVFTYNKFSKRVSICAHQEPWIPMASGGWHTLTAMCPSPPSPVATRGWRLQFATVS